MRPFQPLVLVALAIPVLSETHYLYSGFFSGSTIVGLEFDDATLTLTLENNITTQATSGSKWIALDEQKQNLYVATTGYFQSYALTTNGSLSYSSQVALSSNCTNTNFISTSPSTPYTVFGTPYSTSCPTLAISVSTTGALQSALTNVTYDATAGVHGTSLSPASDFLYSADDMGNAVWTHSFNSTTGTAVQLQRLSAPSGANPRHLATHPNGRWVYVVYEELNQLATYERDVQTGLLTDANTTYPLIPAAYTNTSSYWADEVLFSIPSSDANSTSPKYLITGTRSRTTSSSGYISAFALDASSGAITEQLFLIPSTGSGGSANAVSPAPFGEQYFAITDSGSNFVEVWRIDEDGKSAESVAHLDLGNGPANVVWVS
ncbi:3-carboxy-cis,cis-mucoante lactonizing enzyme [Lophiostoma macrostomum CBS 122681]|uniref:3-carboxy-cis,cis-mucoante lactonizing enzyme n=1 Tax=Lophiostoma macrostomum CBS 122681 TaxID=1314788 RepID=A0A6A6T731_9PLEO|nr:3-carboxy-cis,cis-mucoante lactonizing enzyme [Lophiostoma macrostomum CBS 122681]